MGKGDRRTAAHHGRIDAVLGTGLTGNLAFIGHGGVGTLLLLLLDSRQISRVADQPAGGGNYFAYDIEARRILHGWRPIDELAPHSGI